VNYALYLVIIETIGTWRL